MPQRTQRRRTSNSGSRPSPSNQDSRASSEAPYQGVQVKVQKPSTCHNEEVTSPARGIVVVISDSEEERERWSREEGWQFA